MTVLVRCASCQRPAEAVEATASTLDGSLQIVARCHGSGQEIRLVPNLLRTHEGEVLEVVAFAKRLPDAGRFRHVWRAFA